MSDQTAEQVRRIPVRRGRFRTILDMSTRSRTTNAARSTRWTRLSTLPVLSLDLAGVPASPASAKRAN
jgi:hypothetical protein